MGKHHHSDDQHEHNNRRHRHERVTSDQTALQIINQSAEQTESEKVVVEKSTHISVTQTETQALTLTQAALEAALQALIAFSRTHNVNINTNELQAIIQRVKQAEKEKVRIVKSSDVSITQTESQLATIAQAATDLLAQIVARL